VANGTIPATMQAVIDTMPGNQKFAARMLIKGATQFVNTHPMSAVFAAAMGMTEADVDALYDLAATL